MIEWFARNPVAANLLMVVIVVIGILSASRSIPLEVFPSFEVDAVTVSTVLRGATPRSVEDTITTRIEEAVSDLEGIKEIISTSAEGLSTVIIQIESGYEKRQILNDVKLRIDALNTLPADAEIQAFREADERLGAILKGENAWEQQQEYAKELLKNEHRVAAIKTLMVIG